LTFHGTLKNPARLYKLQGQGVAAKPSVGEKIIYHLKTKTPEVINATQIGQ
jgi:hypothetical protein